MKPLTIITTVLNGKPHIEGMLASVPANPNIEHLVIDAGSSDGTLEILRTQPHLTVSVRPGLSLYGAWNEAIAAAQGRYIAFLNADDALPFGALDTMLSWLDRANGSELLCGEADAFATDSPGRTHRVLYRYRGKALAGRALEPLIFGAPLINAKLFPRQLILDCGGFDPTLSLAADRDLMLRLALLHRDVAWHCVAQPLYRYRIHAGSKTLQPTAATRIHIAREHRMIAARLLADLAADRDASAMLSAWAAHETAVTALRALQAGALGAAGAALRDFLLDAPGSFARLAAARRWRRSYAEKLRAAGDDATPSEKSDRI